MQVVSVVVHHRGVLVEAAWCGAAIYRRAVGIEAEDAFAARALQQAAAPAFYGAHRHVVVFGAGTFEGKKFGCRRGPHHIDAAMPHIDAVGVLFYRHSSANGAKAIVLWQREVNAAAYTVRDAAGTVFATGRGCKQ